MSKTKLLCLPCQYCRNETHRWSGCPKASVCLACKTKNHGLHYIHPLMQNPVAKPTWGKTDYHSDDTSHGHPRGNKAKYDELHMSPVTSQLILSVVYPSKRHSVTLGMLITKRSLIGPKKLISKRSMGIVSKKAVTTEVTKSMDICIHIKHPHIIKGTLIALQEGMVVVEGGPYGPPSGNGPNHKLSGGGHNGHYGVPGGGSDAPKMIHTEQVVKAHCLLNQSNGINKIDMPSKISLNKAL